MAPEPRTDRVRVWDPLLRLGHWLLAASVIASWWTRHGGHETHERLGYVALAVVAIRIAWGFAGPRPARFASFLRGPSATLRHARALWHGRERRHLGHNPLGAWMVVALLALAALTGVSGWLYTTDRYWGVEWVETLHATAADLLLAFAALHLLGVAWTSRRYRENLAAAMIHGRKRARRRRRDTTISPTPAAATPPPRSPWRRRSPPSRS